MIEDFFKLAVDGITHKGVRSYLTMIGIVIGIAAVVSLIALGQGMQNAINKQFEMLGTNMIMVMPGSSEDMGLSAMTSPAKMTKKDLEAARSVSGVDLATGFSFKYAQVNFKGEIKYTGVAGFPTDESQDLMFDGTGIRITEGQKRFRPGDRYKAAIGYLIGTGDFFKKKVEVGDKIEIDGKKFDVVAKVSQVGNPSDDSQIYIPAETADEIFDMKDEYMVLWMSVKDGYDIEKVAEKVKKEIREERGLDKGEEDFSVQTLDDLMESVGSIMDAVTWVLIGIAAISLVVGGVGIMNTMYTSVLERTKEIGVMKAIGAQNKDIMLLFTIESGLMGVVGGIVGCIIGVGLAMAVQWGSEIALKSKLIEVYITPELIIGALTFSFVVGFLSGILPAKQASELNTVDALRYE